MRRIVGIVLVLVVMGLGAIGRSEAVDVSPGYNGDALIFALWDVNNLNTLIAIENTQLLSQTTVQKVRFRSDTGTSVLEFTLCLVGVSTWTAAIFRDGPQTRVVSGSTALVDGSPTLNAILSPDATRGYIEVIGLRQGTAGTAICTDASLGGDVDNSAVSGHIYYVNPAQSPILAYGTNALALKDFAAAKLADGTVLGNEDVAHALVIQGSFGSLDFNSRYFVDPAFGVVTQVVMTFATGPNTVSCPSCRVPATLKFRARLESGANGGVTFRPTSGKVVNVFTVTSSDIPSSSGGLLLISEDSLAPGNLPTTGFVVQTTTSPPPGQPVFNVLFPLGIQ